MNYYVEKRGNGQRAFLQPLLDHFGAMRLKDITPVVVSNYVQDKFKGLEPSSIKRMFYTPMNAVMRAGNRAQLCPLVLFEAPKVEKKPVEYANDVWLRIFMENAHARIAVTVLFMTLTAARVSEACNLEVRDIDVDRGAATLRRTKTGKSRRITLPPKLTELLRQWMLAEKLFEGGQSVFGYSGRWSVNQAIERVCDKANLKAGAIRLEKVEGKTEKRRVIIGPLALQYYSSHQVGRHAFAARLLAEGKSLKLVKEAGGWASIQIVSENYGHLEQSAIDEALRETGNDAITKLGSAVPLLPAPEIAGQEIGTFEENDVLLDAIKRRHSLEQSGVWDGGR